MRNYTIFIDGISKAYAATGVRVGWAFGPNKIITKMKSILGHVGAWSPKAEQVATAIFLENPTASSEYLSWIKANVLNRLEGFYQGIKTLQQEGFAVDAISPQAAIYLTVRFDLRSRKTPKGKVLDSTKEFTQYLLDEAKLAIVPFYAFGSSIESPWYRLSVGNSSDTDVKESINTLRNALAKLQ